MMLVQICDDGRQKKKRSIYKWHPCTVRKLIVEVVEARNLVPKDGHGTSSPYVQLDFYGQRKKTRTSERNLNPTWNEVLEFNVGNLSEVFGDMLEVDVFHDKSYEPTTRSSFLGRIRLNSTQFVRKGEETLMYFPLEKKNLFSWIQGDIGLRIYYVDEVVPPQSLPPLSTEEVKPELAPLAEPAPPPKDQPKPPDEAGKQAEPAPPPNGDMPNEEPPVDQAEVEAENAATEAEKPAEEPQSEPPPPTEESKDQVDPPPAIDLVKPGPELL